jgi:predicted MPP superfamily phosphohydrolase
VSLWQRARFRVRHLTIPVTGLPKDLDGLTVTHLTDLHVGNFFPADAVPAVIAAVDALRPEVVVFTGDLIDRGLFTAIPGGFKLIDHLVAKYDAFAMIEGNHDVLGNAGEFERIAGDAARRKYLPGDPSRLLLDEGRVVHPRGRGCSAVELLGLSWGRLVKAGDENPLDPDPTRTVRVQDDVTTAAQVRALAAGRTPSAFPILLAHHPHAFDAAAEVGLPLTLAGHSHGGQIMLTNTVGVGPMRFRYWAGVHERNGCRMSISNGIGAWFPLRVNAPAEIVHMTLKCSNA